MGNNVFRIVLYSTTWHYLRACRLVVKEQLPFRGRLPRTAEKYKL